MRIVCQPTGFQELNAALRQLPLAVSRRATLRALTKAAAPVVNAARHLAPRGKRPYKGKKVWRNRAGPLADSVRARAVKGVTAEGVTVSVSASPEHFYDLFVHEGHDVVVGGRKRRYSKVDAPLDAARRARALLGWETRRKNRAARGRAIKYGTVLGRTRANRFLTRAFEATQRQVVPLVAEAFWDSLQRAAKGLGNRAEKGTLTRKDAEFLRGPA